MITLLIFNKQKCKNYMQSTLDRRNVLRQVEQINSFLFELFGKLGYISHFFKLSNNL